MNKTIETVPEIQLISRHEFSSRSHECKKRRAFESVEIITAKNEKYDTAVGLSDIIDAVVWEKSEDVKEMFDFASQVVGYEEETSEFDTETEALKLKTEKKARRWKRFCQSMLDRGWKNYAKEFPTMNIEVGDLYAIPYFPQFLTVRRNPITKIVTVEAARYADKKAPSGVSDRLDILEEVRAYDTQIEKDEDSELDKFSEERLKNVRLWIDEYLGCKYIEQILLSPDARKVLGIEEGERVEAVGSVYYMEMKSNDDTIVDFFEGNSNVISLSESYIAGKLNESSTELDDLFKDYAVKHYLGKEATQCSKKDCEWCSMNESCGFQKANKKLKVEKTVSSNAKADYKPTAAQQAIIDLVNLV